MGGRGSSSGKGISRAHTFSTGKEADEYFSVGKQGGMFPDWERTATGEERDATNFYTSMSYWEINGYLRKGTLDEASEKIQNAVKNIDSAVKKFNLKDDIIVYRGGSAKLIGGAITVDQIKAKVGKVFRDDGITSTSVTKDKAYNKGVIYEIKVPKGRGRGIYVEPITDFHGEYEFMMGRGTNFKITGAYSDDKGRLVCQMTAVYNKKK